MGSHLGLSFHHLVRLRLLRSSTVLCQACSRGAWGGFGSTAGRYSIGAGRDAVGGVDGWSCCGLKVVLDVAGLGLEVVRLGIR